MSRRARAQVSISGIDVTEKLNKDTLSLTYTDNSGEDADGNPEADTIELTIQNRTQKWMDTWTPKEGDTLGAKIISEEWNGALDLGGFIIDKVGFSGWPHTVSIGGIAMPVNKDFSGVPRNRTWSGATLREIAESVAGRNNIPLRYEAQYNPKLKFISQTQENDKAFLHRLCKKYGLTMKLYSTRIIIYDMSVFEKGKPTVTLRPSDMTSYSCESSISDTGYSACVVSYTDKTGKLLQYKYEIKGKTEKVYQHATQVGSLAEAQRVAKAKLRELNICEKVFSCTVMGNPGLVAGMCVVVEGFGAFDGKYMIDKAVHNLGGGYTVDLEMHRVMVEAEETTAEIKVGDIVQFSGGSHYVSSDSPSPSGGTRTAGPAKVTNIAKGAPHPYHLIGGASAPEAGGSSNVYGWVDAGTVSGGGSG